MAKKPQPRVTSPSLENLDAFSGRVDAGAFTGSKRDATSLFGNPVFAETLKGLQENAQSRSNDYDLLRESADTEQGFL